MEPVTLTSYSNAAFEHLILNTVLKALSLASSSPKMEESYLDIAQAASFLRIPKSTLYSYTSKRLIPFYKRGKRLTFRQTDLEQWLLEGKKKSVAEIEDELSSPKRKKGDRK